MDTRANLFILLDYKEYYGLDRTLAEAQNLIRNIPSITLLNYLSGFNVNLYLNENNDNSGKIQAHLIDSILGKCGNEEIEKWKSVLKRQVENGHAPIVIWNYSNLLFYELIFKRFNSRRSRDLSKSEAINFFNAYLIVNSFVNNKIHIEEKELTEAAEMNKAEEIVMPNFIYQKDYASTTDFSNQVTRGVAFFEYLENHSIFKSVVYDLYNARNISGFLKMFKNLMVLFTEIKISNELKPRNQLVDLKEYVVTKEIDLPFIETLCINSLVKSYSEDQSFTLLREHFLYRVNAFQFFVLDVNFLIDWFYKAQVFSFNAYLKQKHITNDFLSIKAKEFMEDTYLPTVFNACFPTYEKHFGDACVNSEGTELCDVYLREGNKICLIEFKDVLLSAAVKNSADKDTLFAEFDKKFVANQKKKRKGVTQLIHAIKDIEQNSIKFDKNIIQGKMEIFPIVLYTDFSFGVEGLNKKFKEKFSAELKQITLKKIEINDVTFINLSFFEIRENYLAQGALNIFEMIREYHKHIEDPQYCFTPFEVFSRFYMNKYASQDLGLPKSYQALISRIVAAK